MSFDDFDVFLVILYYIFKTRVSLLFIYLFIFGIVIHLAIDGSVVRIS